MEEMKIKQNLGERRMMFADEENPAQRAFLIGTYTRSTEKALCAEHLGELALLADTLGIGIIDTMPCSLRQYDTATYLTKGKLEEFAAKVHDLDVDLVIFDNTILPSQQRNLEAMLNVPVIDRTEVILEVFAKRAQTREACLQIELAKAHYQSPRLKNMWQHLSRQSSGGGGGVHVKGEGEKQISIDKSLIKSRISQLTAELEEVRRTRDIQRRSRDRSGIPTFAIIGYTNAGKSTLLNALTDAGVFVEDKLFATLDTTTRKYTLPNNQEILLIDTVGFIRKLPHTLVEAFKSTLEEAVRVDILLNIVDVSHPLVEEQMEATGSVLKELGAESKPTITVLNKIDLCDDSSKVTSMRIHHPKSVPISALKKEGFEDLIAAMLHELSSRRNRVALRIPQSDYYIVADVISKGNIISQEYDENDIVIQADIPGHLLGKITNYVIEDLD